LIGQPGDSAVNHIEPLIDGLNLLPKFGDVPGQLIQCCFFCHDYLAFN
jgi:hypothetical protein